MAERGSWWDSWYKAAKDKSVEVLEFVKRDLDEFSTAVKSEASNVVTTTTSALKDKLKLDEPESTANSVKRSVSSFLGQVSNALSPPPQDEDEEAIMIFNSQPVPLTPFQKKLHALIIDPDTFLVAPSEADLPQYKAWLEVTQEVLNNEQRLARMLAANPDLHCQYTRLVPEKVSASQFWEHYLFKKALLEDDEARREAMERRAERERQAAENFCWEQEDFGTHIELSEEEQTRLLQEYEKECENKKLLRNTSQEENLVVEDNHYSENVNETPVDTPVKKSSSVIQKDKEQSEDTDDLSVGERKDLVIVSPDGNSCHTTSSCSGDKESNDGDWEREFDLDDPELENQAVVTSEQGKV
ncbi:hypothetical protein R5R35_005686 [Gryllus longicercus]|uniref:BSD domain-containing protein n=1 Tax=Gryllus longicercus TaxID=2509291 RepID=A0AAN9Z798_9ORTH